MADFSIALAKTLRSEGGFFHNQTTGEVVNRGINHWTLRSLGLMPGVPKDTPRSVPASASEIEFVRTLDMELTATIYREEYWGRICGDAIPDQDVANKVFDLQVNTGQGVCLLQRAINRLRWPSGLLLSEDNSCGPKTLAAMEPIESAQLLDQIRVEASAYYHHIALADPNKQAFLDPWLRRLAA